MVNFQCDFTKYEAVLALRKFIATQHGSGDTQQVIIERRRSVNMLAAEEKAALDALMDGMDSDDSDYSSEDESQAKGAVSPVGDCKGMAVAGDSKHGGSPQGSGE